MTFAQIKDKSIKQLYRHRRFRIISSVFALVAIKLFFVFLRLVCADFLLENKMLSSFSLVINPENMLIFTRMTLFFTELILSCICFFCLIKACCDDADMSIKKFLRLIAFRLALSLLKLPHLICAFVSLRFFYVILFEYNAKSAELAVAVLMLLCAVCLLLMYLYMLVGFFVVPLLISYGETVFTAMARSLMIMKKNRARLLGFSLRCLPEALLIFTLPKIAMYFIVFAKNCAKFYSDDI